MHKDNWYLATKINMNNHLSITETELIHKKYSLINRNCITIKIKVNNNILSDNS